MVDEYVQLRMPSGKPLHILKRLLRVQGDDPEQYRHIFGDAKVGVVDDGVFEKHYSPEEEISSQVREKNKQKDYFGVITVFNESKIKLDVESIIYCFRHANQFFAKKSSKIEEVYMVASSPENFYYMLSSDRRTIYKKDGSVYFKFKLSEEPTAAKDKAKQEKTGNRAHATKPSPVALDRSIFDKFLNSQSDNEQATLAEHRLGQLYNKLSDALNESNDGEYKKIQGKIFKLAEEWYYDPRYGFDVKTIKATIEELKKPRKKKPTSP